MKKSLFLFIFVLFASCELYSQSFATVDTRILLILHPSMTCFDYKNSAFFRDQNQDKVSSEVFKELKAAQAKANKENEIYYKEIEELKKERSALSISLLREEQVFAPGDLQILKKNKVDMEKALAEMRKKKVSGFEQIKLNNSKIAALEKEIDEINAVITNPASIVPNKENIDKYKERINNIDIKINDLNDKILLNQDKSMSAIYLTQAETEERLTKIRDEIKQIISEIAKEENCSMVIDSSFAMRDPEREARKVILSGIEENQDVVSASLFHSFTNYQPDLEFAKHLDMPEGESAVQHLIVGRSIGLEQNLKQYLEYRDYVPAKVADFTFGSLFISGGKDLTSLCAKRLFDKYDIPEYTRQRFLPVLKEYTKTK